MKTTVNFGSKTISARIPIELYNELNNVLKKEKTTVNQFIELMVLEYLKMNTMVIQCMDCNNRFKTTDEGKRCPKCKGNDTRII